MIIVTVEFILRPGVEKEFAAALAEMQERIKRYDGFLGEEPCRSLADNKKFVTIFYFRDRESAKAWRDDPEHARIQKLGRDKLFAWYRVRIAEIEREYGWDGSDEALAIEDSS